MSSPNVTTRSRMKTVNVEATVDSQEYTLYTCPQNCRSHMSMLFVSNSGGNVTVDVEFYRAADSTHIHILGGKNMTTGEYIQFTGAEMVLEPGDYVTTTAVGGTVHVDTMATVEEFFLVPG
jgi:DNA/RNA endonuclease YhcR with UshA esterase domain